MHKMPFHQPFLSRAALTATLKSGCNSLDRPRTLFDVKCREV